MDSIPQSFVDEIHKCTDEIGSDRDSACNIVPSRKSVHDKIGSDENQNTVGDGLNNGAFVVFVNLLRVHVDSLHFSFEKDK